MRILFPFPAREFDPTESSVPWRALVDAGDARLGSRGLDGLQRAASTYASRFVGASEKSSYNIFTQTPWYVGKLAGSAKLPSLRRLIDNQQEFIAAFEEIIRRVGIV